MSTHELRGLTDQPQRHTVLLVDDEMSVTEGLQRALRKEPYAIECASSGAHALERLAAHVFDVIVSDERMPGMTGSELLEIVRRDYPDMGRIVLSGQASFEAVLKAVNSGEIYRYLIKPCPPEEVAQTIREALALCDERRQMSRWVREHLGGEPRELERRLETGLARAWIGFQPIIRAAPQSVYGYEALLRSEAAGWDGPLQFFKAAEALGRASDVGRRVRALVAERLDAVPGDARVFVNVTHFDLADEEFLDGRDPLGRHAARIVLEVTERMSLDQIDHLEGRLARLRAHGYHIALDDIGAGYAGLASLVVLAPDFVKFDADLIRAIDRSATKRQVVGTMVRMCSEMGVHTLAEGVETRGEHDTAVSLGCELLQGFLYGRATREFSAACAVPSGLEAA